MTRSQIEQILGDPALFIVTPENEPLLRDWALSAGYPAVQVHSMTAVALANLYHSQGGSDAAHRAVIATMQAILGMNAAPVDPDTLRALVREEVAAHAASLVQRIEVTSPTGSTVLTGPQHYKTESIVRKLARGDHIMMVGPAGCGKTTIGERAAEALRLAFHITNAINETHELLGFIDGYGKYHDTPFRRAFSGGGVWIADEIDAWDASALLVANSALANGFATFPDNEAPIKRHADFRMVATANTFGSGADRIYVGRNELDAASLDRFAVVNVDYDTTLERLFANGQHEWLQRVWDVRKIVTEKRIRHVVSSRAIIFGARALNDGEDWAEAEDVYLFKGMSEKDRSKIDG